MFSEFELIYIFQDNDIIFNATVYAGLCCSLCFSNCSIFYCVLMKSILFFVMNLAVGDINEPC
jgi:hypothetical protein